MNTESGAVLKAENLHKNYIQGDLEIPVLGGLNFELARAEQVAVVGRSGSGKSTLMHVLAGLDTPDKGSVLVDGVDLASADNDTRARVRSHSMGFVYQNHHLLPEFSALENVAMPLRIDGNDRPTAEDNAAHLLSEVGLKNRLGHLPHQLSGGERQRVAVARALAGDPKIILADEPTGNLDAETAAQVIELMHTMSAEHGCAFLVVTHDPSALPSFSRVVRLADGILT
ncbi:MAG: ATP-binding cassette domain-containing protein [Pseudomonadales bacterium]|nr:ATP-binding cassette domain-containing protein [Pseudomonadales bacterium]